ncbi:GAP family protein [Mycobacterium sp.]|uniref:GAP family protein n=1 Tax=Mycobacterium sp. TaxID=1785 RepID=UPI003A88449D
MGRLLVVTGNWGSLITKLVPLALVIAVSPLTVIPAVLVLHTPRPRVTSLAFLGGWASGLAGVTGLFVAGAAMFTGLKGSPPAWASWLRVVLGSALILFGVYRWCSRHGHTEAPRWMRAFHSLTPVRAGLIGMVLTVVRLEVLLICLAGGVAIGTTGLDPTGKWFFGAVFVVLAASTVAIPILGYAGAGDRLDDQLNRLKAWMEQNHAGMLAAVLVLIGLMVFYNGIRAL